MSQWRDLIDTVPGKAPANARRSSQWRRVRDAFILGKSCSICNSRRYLVAHHVIPFHLAPHLELDPRNLMVLCESKKYGINCHLLVGHVGNWRRINPIVHADVAYWNNRIILSR